MFIDRYAELWRAVAQDEARPSLQHVLITDSTEADRLNIALPEDHNGLALATDGFILAIVPVQLEDGDQTGPLDPRLIQYAAKETPKSFPGAWLDLTQPGRVRLINQTDWPRYLDGQHPGNWPDIKGFLPAARPKGGNGAGESLAVHPTLSVNTAYLIDLTRALGSRYIKSKRDEIHYRLVYLDRGPSPKVLVEPCRRSHRVGASWRAPLGLLMPVYDIGAAEAYYQDGRPRQVGNWKVI